MNPITPDSTSSRSENVPLADIAARFGTPCYVYSHATLTGAFVAYRDALAQRHARICYAVKANSNLSILKLFASLGAGFDIVSGGELARVIAAGGDPGKVVFSGVGKSKAEIETALQHDIYCFNVESASELDTLAALAVAQGKRAPIALRVNPDVDPKTHPYISTGLKSAKFGVAFDQAAALYRRAQTLPGLHIRGIACHIGSQLLDPQPAADAAAKLIELVDALSAAGIVFEHIDLGGGMGIRYRDEAVLSVADYLAPMLETLAGRKELLLFEPGRSLVGNAGLLLTRVEVLKHGTEKNFAIVDAAMNDLARPALYDAYHEIVKVGAPQGLPSIAGGTASQGKKRYEIVGPVCESGDFLGHDRELELAEGDLLAVLSAGAYGMAMSSNYNTRPRVAEVMVDGSEARLIRRRETLDDLLACELPLL
jgi:diaminopimelate decarboxylase